MDERGSRDTASRQEALRIWTTLGVVSTAAGVIGAVSAVVSGSASWWLLVGVALITASS